jgi:lincosamide nucleotidyltransferase A/C/D/E
VTDGDVLEIVGLLSESGIRTWLYGGWACDALVGEQTRRHADLDLVLAVADRGRAVEILQGHGFTVSAVFDAGLLGRVAELIDRRRLRSVGLHFVDSDAEGPNGWQTRVCAAVQALGLDLGGFFAKGTVAGQEFPCLSAPVLLALHTGYEPGETDRRDVQLLCRHFSLPLPPSYEPH